MNGTAATTFSPDSGLTRAMAITMLGRLTGAEQQDTDTFGDVAANRWYSGYVGWAVEQSIVYGYGDGNFGPNDSVTVGQFGLMLERCGAALGLSYDSGLTGNQALTRAEAAQALYDFSLIL